MLGLHRDIVELYPHQKEWEEAFETEKIRLKEILGGRAIDIQHVGSTALPIYAKPIIDVAVDVESRAVLEALIPELESYGYNVKNSLDTIGELCVAKGEPENRTHYIHMVVQDKIFGNHQVLFRDYLLLHKDKLKEYEELKKGLYEKHKNERKKYTASKNDFIVEIIELAKQEKLNKNRQEN